MYDPGLCGAGPQGAPGELVLSSSVSVTALDVFWGICQGQLLGRSGQEGPGLGVESPACPLFSSMRCHACISQTLFFKPLPVPSHSLISPFKYGLNGDCHVHGAKSATQTGQGIRSLIDGTTLPSR